MSKHQRGLGARRLALPALAAALATALATPAPAQEVTLPSGLAARLYDVVLEPGAAGTQAPDAFTDPESGEVAEPADGTDAAAATGVARFRLVVPGLGGEGAGFDAVAGDLAWLCATLALPALAANGWAPSEVTVALADREVEHGATDPAAVQFFEGFRVEEGACVPLAF